MYGRKHQNDYFFKVGTGDKDTQLNLCKLKTEVEKLVPLKFKIKIKR